MRIFIKFLAIFLMGTFILSGYASAESQFEASLEKTRVSQGNPVYLYLTFYGGRDFPRPDVAPVKGLRFQYVGPSTKVSVVNGKVSQSITHTYLIMTKEKGTYTLGPFFADYKGNTYKADAVRLSVSDVPQQTASTASRTSSSAVSRQTQAAYDQTPDLGDKIFLKLEVGKRKAYINETIPVIIKVYVSGVGLRDIEYPAYAHDGFATEDYAEPEKRNEVIHGTRYQVLVFRQDISPIKEGEFVLGPATMNCTALVRSQKQRRRSFFGSSIFDDDFFSVGTGGYTAYPMELTSKEVPITVLPFPKDSQPDDFGGAVGNFDMDVHVQPKRVRVGDPVSVRMEISGLGNFATVMAPSIYVGKDFKTYEPQVTQKGYKKIYEQILIPRNDKVKTVPEVSFSYFDPRSAKYRTIKKGPFSIEVEEQLESEKGVKVVSASNVGEMMFPQEQFGQDIIHIKYDIGSLSPKVKPLFKNIVFWVVQMLFVICFLYIFISRGNTERIKTDKRYARFTKAPKRARAGLASAKKHLDKGELNRFYDVIFKTFQDYLSGRMSLPKGGVSYAAVEEKALPAGCSEEVMNVIKDVFSECEMARYAPSSVSEQKARILLENVKRSMSQLEKLNFK